MHEQMKIERLVDQTLSPSDKMFEGNLGHYFSVGLSAMENILRAVSIARTEPRRILDFGCGAGRVTRWIVESFPQAEIEGCDIRDVDINFVAETFGVQTWRSGVDVATLHPQSTYDLIWVGSVFTHLSEAESITLFERLVSWLNPRGVLVLTSHGRHPASVGEQAGYYGVADEWERVVDDFQRLRFGYADYAETPGYGISLIQLAWWADLVTRRSDLRLIAMAERAWDHHQDVIAVQRV